MKLFEIVCKVYDTSFEVKEAEEGKIFCSRCLKEIVDTPIEISPKYIRDFRWKVKIFRYHYRCIEENKLLLKMNYLGFVVAYRLYQIRRKLVFIDTVKYKLRKGKEKLKRIQIRYKSWESRK